MMVSIEAADGLERKMRVEVPAEQIDREIESRLKRVGRTAKIAGFRPGKVPAKVIRQRYGGQVRQEVLSELVQSSYSEALRKEKLLPAGSPQIEPEPADADGGLRYVATFEVFPEIELSGLESIRVERPEVEMTDADVDAMLENLREQKAEWVDVERDAAAGDQVIVDFDGTLGGEPIEHGKGEDVEIVLGEGRMLPDFEKALTGAGAGQELDFQVSYPKDYPKEDLAGRKAEFKAAVKSVREKQLPPLDDTLASAYGVDEGGLDKLREGVLDNMRNEVAMKVRNDVKQQVLDALLAANDIDVPASLLTREQHTMQHEAMRRMGVTEHDQAPPAETFAEPARKRVKLGLLMQEFIEREGVVLDESRLRERVAEMFAGYDDPETIIDTYVSNPELRRQIEPMILEDQAVELLAKKGKETTRSVAFSDYMNA
ncbi:MAG: trigger factor [Pseudomonadota bacterium]